MKRLEQDHFQQNRRRKFGMLLGKMTLWSQLVLFMAFAISIITFILIYNDYTSTRNATIRNLTDTKERLLRLETENLENYISDLANFCILPCYDLQLVRMIEQKTSLADDQLRYLKEQMYYYYYTRNDIDDYHIFLLNQNLAVGRSRSDQRISDSVYDVSVLEDIYRACKISRYNHVIYPADNTASFFTYYHTMIRIQNQNPQALVKIQVDRSYLDQLLTNHSDHGELLLLTDQNGNLIYSSMTSLIDDSDILQDVLATSTAHRGTYTTVTVADEEYLLVTSGIVAKDIQLLSLTPLAYIDSQIGAQRNSLIATGIFIWLCAVLLINMFIRLLTNPLKLLSKQMERTGSGDFHTLIHTGGSREIEELTQSFNSMVIHIDELIRRTYLAELSEKNARITALEAQLNPHFLYNTLQAISTEALINDQPQINRMITSLASSLRYTIKGGDLVTLKKEMEYVRDYIYLQRIRMDNNLEVQISIDPETEECLIPKISIQTLVENSIIHGIRSDKESITIQISSEMKDNNIIIRVLDNGCGIPKEQLALLYEDFEKQEKNFPDGGIGLVNLYTRLHLLYTKPAHLTVQSEYGEYTEILLELPVTFENEGGQIDVQGTDHR